MSSTQSWIDLFAVLDKEERVSVYDCPWTCRAVFQSLPLLCQQVVLRLVLVDCTTSVLFLRNWFAGHRQHTAAVETLKLLRLVKAEQPAPGPKNLTESSLRFGRLMEDDSPDSKTHFRLTSPFRERMRESLCSMPPDPWLDDATVGSHVPTERINSLTKFAEHQWANVLNFLVLTSSEQPSEDIVKLLVDTRLLTRKSGDETDAEVPYRQRFDLSSDGYEFLLKETGVQLWTFMVQFVKSAAARGFRAMDIIHLLCKIVPELQAFGMVCAKVFKSGERKFFPTPLVSALTSPLGASNVFDTPMLSNLSLDASGSATGGASRHDPMTAAMSPTPGAAAAVSSLQIIVEKNFKVYAYTTSPLHASLLGLFIRVEARLPNMTVGILTRDSVQAALRNSVSAEQMVEFLAKHAHPRCSAAPPIIPENVVDQLYLWELERARAQFDDVTMIHQFDDQAEFDSWVKLAEDLQRKHSLQVGVVHIMRAGPVRSQALFVSPELYKLMRKDMDAQAQAAHK